MSGRNKHERLNAFEQTEGDLAAVADEIYGPNRGKLLDTGRIVATPTDIWSISPDPRQPRRALPSVVRSQKLGGHASLLHWMYRAYCETTGTPVNPETHRQLIASDQVEAMYRRLIAGEEVQLPEQPGLLEAGLLALVELAANIRQNGLVNPITIAQVDRGSYVIETGERRWLAHHLLAYFGYAGFDKIPARVVDFDVWRQAAENNQRSDLNAIGRARQFAILLMDLLRQDGVEFRPFELFEREQDYYAQVADAETYRIPHGKTDQLLNAMGIKSRQALSDYRRLLSLPNEVWIQADDNSWAQEDLLKIVRDADNFGINSPIQTEETPAFGINDESTPPPPAIGQGDFIPNAPGQTSPPDPLPIHGEEEAEEAAAFQIGDRVLMGGRTPGTIRYIKNGRYGVFFDHSRTTHYYDAGDLTAIDEAAADTDIAPADDVPQFAPGDRVNTRGLHMGTVISQRGRIVSVRTDNDQRIRSHHAVDLTLVSRAAPAASAASSKESAPVSQGRWPKVGDRVVTQTGIAGEVAYLVGKDKVSVRTAQGISIYAISILRPFVDAGDDDAGAGEDNGSVPASDAVEIPQQRAPGRFALPFTSEPTPSTGGLTGRMIMDFNRRMVARWNPSPLESAESTEWIDWLIELGNAYHFSEQVQQLLRVIEYVNGSGPDDYYPADAQADLDALIDYLEDATATVQRDLDQTEGS